MIGSKQDGGTYSFTYPSKFNNTWIYIDAHVFGNCLRYVNDLEEHNAYSKYIIKKDNTWGVYFISHKNINEGE